MYGMPILQEQKPVIYRKYGMPILQEQKSVIYRKYGMPILQEQKSVTPQSREKTINRGALEVY